ncbi:hypothetical protein pb186bvf_008452 [Paramecium bursaria]
MSQYKSTFSSKRSTFLGTSSTSSLHTALTRDEPQQQSKARDLRRYPTEFQEVLDGKSGNRYYQNVVRSSLNENIPGLSSPSKIFGVQKPYEPPKSQSHQKSQSQNTTQSQIQLQTFLHPRHGTKRLDQIIPLSELYDIERILDNANADEFKGLSKQYIRELLNLAQSINKNIRHQK